MVSRMPSLSDDFVSLRDAMDRFFGEGATSGLRNVWPSSWSSSNGRMPLPLDVYAGKDEIVMIAAVPGLNPDDIEITINQNTITISGKIANVAGSEDAKDATWYLHELAYGAFTRSVTLPVEVDASRTEASFEHGILKLRLPKAETAKPKQIKVRVGGQQPTDTAIEAGQNGQS